MKYTVSSSQHKSEKCIEERSTSFENSLSTKSGENDTSKSEHRCESFSDN